MTFERFLAQSRATGREYGDGYDRSHFAGLSAAEERAAVDLLTAAASKGDDVAMNGLAVLGTDPAIAVLKDLFAATSPQSEDNLALASALWKATRDRAWQRPIAENLIGPDDAIARHALVAYVATVSATPGPLGQDFFITLLLSEEADDFIRSQAVTGILRGYGLPSLIEDQSPAYLDLRRRLFRATAETIDGLLAEARTWMFTPEDLRSLVTGSRAAVDSVRAVTSAAPADYREWSDYRAHSVENQWDRLVWVLKNGGCDDLSDIVRRIAMNYRAMEDAPREPVSDVAAMTDALNALAGLDSSTFDGMVDATTKDFIPEFKERVDTVLHDLAPTWDLPTFGDRILPDRLKPPPEPTERPENDADHVYGDWWTATRSGDGFQASWLTNDPVVHFVGREATAAISESEFERLRRDPASAYEILIAHEDDATLG